MPDNDDTSGSNDPSQSEESSGSAEGQDGMKPVNPDTGLPDNRRARRAAASVSRGKGPRARERAQMAGGLEPGEMVDDALSRAADGSSRWIKSNFNVVQWLIVAGIAGWVGWQIYSWRSDKTAVQVSGLLNDAVAAEMGRVGSPDEEGQRDSRGSLDARRIFETDQARLKTASEEYQAVVTAHPGSTGAALAKLGEAGVLFDQGKFDDAQKVYTELATSDLAKLDPEAKGRSLEGIALCLEAKGDNAAALKRYTELENADIPGFRELALFNEARLMHASGDDAGAKERLKKVLDKLGKESTGTETESYLLGSARALMLRIDPKEVPAPNSNEALQRALQQFQKGLPGGVKTIPVPIPKEP